ncbi:unnamed protein product [Cylicostephanus goldi]|uniref:Uncharacterized protein n=1 Tax=Cylicostephanus goldi TaxID=71465 RepID=A0A3P6R3V6_CYLGO|nr:unnamed protein product [Cylicostephanus goldi]
MRRSWRRLAGGEQQRRDSVDVPVYHSLDDTVTVCDGSYPMSSAECVCITVDDSAIQKPVRRVATIPIRQRTSAHLKPRWVVPRHSQFVQEDANADAHCTQSLFSGRGNLASHSSAFSPLLIARFAPAPFSSC